MIKIDLKNFLSCRKTKTPLFWTDFEYGTIIFFPLARKKASLRSKNYWRILTNLKFLWLMYLLQRVNLFNDHANYLLISTFYFILSCCIKPKPSNFFDNGNFIVVFILTDIRRTLQLEIWLHFKKSI